jgi:hypothetical protein
MLALKVNIDELEKIAATTGTALTKAQHDLKLAEDAALVADKAHADASSNLMKAKADLKRLEREEEIALSRKRQSEATELIFELDTKLSGNQLEILGNILGLKEPHSLANLEKSVRGLNMEDTAIAGRVNSVLERLYSLKSK